MTDLQMRTAAKQFVKDWTGHGDEKQETQRFWMALLQKVFGVSEPDKAIEFEVQKEFIGIGKKLKDINLKKDIVVAFVIRDNKVIIPNGTTTFEKGDRVIIISSAEKNLSKLDEIIQ